jgi:hypothetical protein
MRTFDRVHGHRTEERLPAGQAIAVITGLSVLSWAVVILLALAVRAIV